MPFTNAIQERDNCRQFSLTDSYVSLFRPILTLEQCKDLVSSEVEKAMAGLGRKINKIAMIQKRNEATVATHLAASEYLSMSTRLVFF